MTDILPGQLAYIFGVSILDAALLSWLALFWYRRSVRRLMREAGAGTTAPHVESSRRPVLPVATAAAGPSGLSLAEEKAETTRQPLDRAGLGRVVLAYCLGAAAYAVVITTLKFAPESPPLPAVAWLVDWWANTWPIVPTLIALLVLDRRRSVRLALLYLVGGAIGIALFTTVGQILRGTLNSAPLTNVFWAMLSLGWTASVPLALVALTSSSSRCGACPATTLSWSATTPRTCHSCGRSSATPGQRRAMTATHAAPADCLSSASSATRGQNWGC